MLFSINQCAVIQNVDRQNLNSLNKENLKTIEGTYANRPNNYPIDTVRLTDAVSHPITKSFWFQVDNYKDWKQDWPNQTIILKVVSDKKIIAELYEDGKMINQKKLKGKIKDGYFYGRPFFIVLPFIPIVWGYNTHRYRIGLIDTDLVIDKKTNYWMAALIVGSDKKEQVSLTFDKR